MSEFETVASVARGLALPGDVIGVERFRAGYIHDSYRVTLDTGDGPRRVLLQRINTSVFPRVDELMENIERVTRHLATKADANPDQRRPAPQGPDRPAVPDARARTPRSLTLIPARDGGRCVRAADGSAWRAFAYIEGTCTLGAVATPALAYEAARAFGAFQWALRDLPGPRLHETIAGFHDTPARLAALERAAAADRVGRAAAVRGELDFARARRASAGRLMELQRDGAIPERIVHNDAKMSNVLFDAGPQMEWTTRPLGDTGGAGLTPTPGANRAVCVVDLDTVMPGLSLFDLGDMIRAMTGGCDEDERDLSRVAVRPEFVQAVVQGYCAGVQDLLSARERELLIFAGWLITLEQGVRFLSDYLSGDVYYQTTRAEQNLDRARVQFRLVESIEERRDELERHCGTVAPGCKT